MKRTDIVLILMIAVSFGYGATDEEIRVVLHRSTMAFDNPAANESELHYAFSLCPGDTNRMTRLMCDVVRERGNDRGARGMVQGIGRYGNASALPFLYSCVTNPALGKVAVISIFKLEGVTTNSVDQFERYLSAPITGLPNSVFRERTWCCRDVLSMTDRNSANRRYLLDCIIRFAGGRNTYVWDLDEKLVQEDSGYRYSRRRAAVLRNSLSLNLVDCERNYVTNAINELIAYPEANLND